MCVFCEILKGSIPSRVVREDDDFIAILDINPGNPGHVVVIPKEHFESIFDMPDDVARKVTTFVKAVAEQVSSVYGRYMNILQNNGAIAGQTCMHYHVHVLPRKEGDGVNIGWAHGSTDLDDVYNKLTKEV